MAYALKGFFNNFMLPATPPELNLPSLNGKVAIVTGGNTGVGFVTVEKLANAGARVYLGARSEEKAAQAIKDIKAKAVEAGLAEPDVRFLKMDLTDLETVQAAAEEFKKSEKHLHILDNNAGIMAVDYSLTKDNYEIQWQTNYISHFVLTNLLLPTLLSTALLPTSKPGDVRIVNLSSFSHAVNAPSAGIIFDDDFRLTALQTNTTQRYGMSKLGNILHARQLHHLYGPDSEYVKAHSGRGEIWVMSVHPGAIGTQLQDNVNFKIPFGLKPSSIMNAVRWNIPLENGAYTSVFCAASDKLTREDSGAYFVPYGQKYETTKVAEDREMQERLWKKTWEILGRDKGLKEYKPESQ